MTDKPLTREHEIKCWPSFYEHIESGAKPFEIRKNDRDYKVGDTLWIREWLPEEHRYTTCECRRSITYVTAWGQQEGYVVLGLASLGPGLEAAAKLAEEWEFGTNIRWGQEVLGKAIRALAAPSTPAGERRKAYMECLECPQGDCSDCPRKYGAKPNPRPVVVVERRKSNVAQQGSESMRSQSMDSSARESVADCPAGAAPHSTEAMSLDDEAKDYQATKLREQAAAPVQAGEKFPDAPAKSRAERIAWDRVAELTEKIQEMSTQALRASSEPVATVECPHCGAPCTMEPSGIMSSTLNADGSVTDHGRVLVESYAHPTPQAERQGGELLKLRDDALSVEEIMCELEYTERCGLEWRAAMAHMALAARLAANGGAR